MIKRIIYALAIVFFTCSLSFAAWTTSLTFVSGFNWKDNTEMLLYKITATSDASGSGDITLSTALQTTYGTDTGNFYHTKMKGGMLYAIEYVPGSVTPTSQATITVDTEDGTIIFSEQVATANTGEMFSGKVDSDFLVPLTDLIFASTTLANAKTATFYIWILK